MNMTNEQKIAWLANELMQACVDAGYAIRSWNDIGVAGLNVVVFESDADELVLYDDRRTWRIKGKCTAPVIFQKDEGEA